MMVSMMNLDPIQVDCGDNCCFVLARNGQLWGWGCGETNQLCQGDPSDVLQPMQIVFPLDDMTEEEYKLTKIDVEYINCGAVASDGTLFVWGFNFEETPRRVESLDDDGVSIKDIAMGQGTLLCR
jgi:alpha-tubulin suppressor-like RCC1 family protein